MEALLDLRQDVFFHIFTTIPPWFFEISLPGSFQYHSIQTDIGLAQNGPLSEDLDLTLAQLAAFYPVPPETAQKLSAELIRLECSLVLCDISVLGIIAANKAGIPSILIENFTWDWIYSAYCQKNPDFAKFSNYLEEQYKAAAYHIQTIPFCQAAPANALVVPPVSRKNKTTTANTRAQLGIAQDCKMVLVTLGGIQGEFGFLDQLQTISNVIFVIPGAANKVERAGNLVLLPHHNQHYHPDLIQASDAIIAKIGYSTLAEAYYAGSPLGYIPRPAFRESLPLEEFVQANFSALQLPETNFYSADLKEIVSNLLELPRRPHFEVNGAIQIARFISNKHAQGENA